MVRFDAYSATTMDAKPQDMLSILVNVTGIGNVKLNQGKGFHTFAERIGVKNESGIEVGSVMWGGRQGDRVMIEVKGEGTPKAVEAIRGAFPHRCTRVDACADFDAPDSFESLLAACTAIKAKHKLKGEKQGDWDDFPELGRTLYLGARASVSRVRLYEKGKQPEYRHLNRPAWTRIEVQVRPAKEAKTQFAKLSPVEVWGASAWTRQLAGEVLHQHIDPHPAGTTYRLTEGEAAIRWMCKQYGSHLVDLAADLGGWDVLGLTLREIVKEAAQPR
jgi:hypothetical protein